MPCLEESICNFAINDEILIHDANHPVHDGDPYKRRLAAMHETLTEQDFRLRADHALEQTQRSLLPLADEEGFEVELQNGVLQVVFEDPVSAKFVVSPNAPVRQIWVSAMSRSYKLTWSPGSSRFELDGESLEVLLARLVRQFITS